MSLTSPTVHAPPSAFHCAGDDGSMLMSQGVARTRLVVAVFDGREELYRAVTELLRRGLAREQMGIVALLSSLPRLRRAASPVELEPAAIATILGDVEMLPIVSEDRVVVTRGSLWQCLGSFATVANDELITAHWMTPNLRDDLATYIRSGAVVLGVSANSIDQQRESTRVLLQHSSYRVQTHEFTL